MNRTFRKFAITAMALLSTALMLSDAGANVPLDGHDTQQAKVPSDLVASDILIECLEGYPAQLTLEVVDGPDIHDYWRYRFVIAGKAHHDQVACIRELVMEEQP